MNRLLFALWACMLGCSAFSAEWICSTGGARLYAQAEEGDSVGAATGRRLATSGARPKSRLTRFELEQAYAGQPVLLGPTWLMVYMLPADHPDTRDALMDLGVSPAAAERMARNTGLVDRGVRMARDPDDMIEKVSNSHPAVGYSQYIPRGANVRACF